MTGSWQGQLGHSAWGAELARSQHRTAPLTVCIDMVEGNHEYDTPIRIYEVVTQNEIDLAVSFSLQNQHSAWQDHKVKIKGKWGWGT